MFEQLINNPDVARVLVIAVAAQWAKEPETRFKRSDFMTGFGRLITKLKGQRSAFMDELRKMERLGPDEYMRRVGKHLKEAGEK